MLNAPANGPEVIKLLGLWLALRVARLIATVVVIAALAMLVLGVGPVAGRHDATGLMRLRHATQPLERQLEHTIEKAFRR